MTNFQKFTNIDISTLRSQLEANPQLWDENSERKGGVHAAMSDIWLRFRPKNELISVESYAEQHIPIWYQSADILTDAKKIALDMIAYFRAVQLGGVLITKIPPGGEIKPHDDKGRWHPEFFNTKVYIPIQSNGQCINTCEGDEVNMVTGEVWVFDNLKTHSVRNEGNTDRITLIISLRVE